MTIPVARPTAVCEFPDCPSPKDGRSDWCNLHTHDWIGLAELELDPARIMGTTRYSVYKIRVATIAKITEVACATCRVTYERGRNTPCDPYSPHLRGGPLGTRKRKEEAEGDAEDDSALRSAP